MAIIGAKVSDVAFTKTYIMSLSVPKHWMECIQSMEALFPWHSLPNSVSDNFVIQAIAG